MVTPDTQSDNAASKPAPSRSVRGAALRLLGLGAFGMLLALVSLWTLGALYYMGGAGMLGKLLMAVFVVAVIIAAIRDRRRVWMVVACFAAVGGIWYAVQQPRTDREWRPELARMPSVEFDGDQVLIKDIRNFNYRSTEEFDAVYVDRTYDLSQLESVDMVLTYWDGNTAIAHSMLSFGFGDGEYLCLSVEVRREMNEDWGGIPGLYKQFEALYILGDERDLVNLRTSYREEDVYLYRLKLPPEDIRTYFEHVLADCNDLRESPRFYGTIQFNCHSSLTRLASKLWPDRDRPSGIKALLNGYADREMYERDGLVTGGLEFDALRERAYVTPAGKESRAAADFSERIRRHLP